MDKRQLQFLRTIDKLDRFGIDYISELLMKPLPDGPNLSLGQTMIVRTFLQPFDRINYRLGMINYLDKQKFNEDYTGLDWLIDLPCNEDQTWKDNGRPSNIAWALDDLIEYFSRGNEK